jgi:DHA2 family multidrug resistance protein
MTTDSSTLPLMETTAWRPSVNPWIIAGTVMLATFMEVLDTSVANVALPHIAGNLSASLDEATWVLTSYLVSNAIVLPMAGWLSRRVGRKRLLIGCITAFTTASVVCGLSTSLSMLVVARVFQGAAGGALQPLSQAILLESFPPAKRGMAMAAFGLGVVVAPIIGPTLGGWLTDNYSWRWVFYINIPVGVLAVLMNQTFLEDPPYLRMDKKKGRGQIDYIGFGLMALGLATLQIILDRGQKDDWFAAPWLRWASLVTVVSLGLFVWWELKAKNPIVDLRVLRYRSFFVGTSLIAVVGVALYSTIALLPLFLQGLMGYPALESGLALSPRGFGAIAAMIVVGRLIGKIDMRMLIAFGFVLLTYSCWLFGNLNLDISIGSVIWPNILSGVAMGFVFVPLTTATMGELPNEEMGNATGIFNLMRNIGGSFGISMAATLLSRGAQSHQTVLSGHLTPYSPLFHHDLQTLTGILARMGDPVAAHSQAMQVFYGLLVRQATLLAYIDTFRLLAVVCALCIPAALVLKRVRPGAGATVAH